MIAIELKDVVNNILLESQLCPETATILMNDLSGSNFGQDTMSSLLIHTMPAFLQFALFAFPLIPEPLA